MAQLTTTAGVLRSLLPSLGNLGGRTTLIGFGSIPLIVAIVLLGIMAREAFLRREVDGYTLENFRVIDSDSFIYGAMMNTVVFTAATILVAAFFGVIAAWLVERTDLPGRGAVFPLITLGVLTPGFVTSMGWLLLGHQRIGILNKFFAEIIPFMDQFPFHVGTVVGMGFVQGVSLSGLMFIMVAAPSE